MENLTEDSKIWRVKKLGNFKNFKISKFWIFQNFYNLRKIQKINVNYGKNLWFRKESSKITEKFKKFAGNSEGLKTKKIPHLPQYSQFYISNE